MRFYGHRQLAAPRTCRSTAAVIQRRQFSRGGKLRVALDYQKIMQMELDQGGI